jgi:hypothetical protein
MEQVTIQDKTSRLLPGLWIGLMIFTLGECCTEMEIPFGNKVGILVGLPLAYIALWRSMTWKLREPVSKAFFVLLAVWTLFMVVYCKSEAKMTIFDAIYTYGWLPYSAIALLLIPVTSLVRSFYTYAYHTYLWYLAVFFIPLLVPWDFGVAQMFFETFVVASIFIFLTNKYHSPRTLLFAVICILVSFLVATLNARRNLMLSMGLYLMVGSCTYVFGSKIKSLENKIVIIAGAALFLLAAIYAFLADTTGAFSLIVQRAGDNTREGVFLYFFIDMDSVQDWLIGRGILGTYYCPGVDADDVDYRTALECGYLHYILKGGCIYLLFYLVTFITAIVRGFRSKNQLCKAAAWILIIQLIDLAPFGLHAFNTKTFMIWMAVAICLSNELRQKSDDDIYHLFFTPRHTPLPWQKN